jgi:hypothetical protein
VRAIPSASGGCVEAHKGDGMSLFRSNTGNSAEDAMSNAAGCIMLSILLGLAIAGVIISLLIARFA